MENDCHCSDVSSERSGRSIACAGGMILFVIALYVVLDRFGVFSLSASVEGTVGLGAAFVTGLLAASSTCLAVVGGLLLSVSASWVESHAQATRWEKLRPMLLFNGGRLVGYFVLGGLTGLLGTSLSLSSRMTGYLTLVIAAVMILLGLRFLRILPKQFCRLPVPNSWSSRLRALSTSKNPSAPLLLGALTFFVPCGFTQSMQLLALASGGFLPGALIMTAFAFGTLPSLLGISIVSSVVEGRSARWFLHFSGAVVLLLGVLNMQSGLRLAGIDPFGFLHQDTAIGQATNDPYVTIDDQGRQIISMYVSDTGYQPDSFTIRAGFPTWVYAIAPNGVSGCAAFLVDSTHNLQTQILKGGNWLGPVENPTKDFLLTCSMGMLRANVRVE